MSELIEFKLDDGTVVMFEGLQDARSGPQRVTRGGEVEPAKAEKTLNQAIHTAKIAAELVLNSFKEMNAPDEINLEFGVKLAVKAGVVIASADSEATFKVALKWKKP